MPWSRSATTVRNAPALGFKQQYAGSGMDGEPMHGESMDGEETDPQTNQINEDAIALDEAHHDLAEIEGATDEDELMALADDAKEKSEAVVHDSIEKFSEAVEVLGAVTEVYSNTVHNCSNNTKEPNDAERRFQTFKQIRMKHLHRRIAALQAKLGARVQPYARPARNLYARATPSPLSTARLSRRIERTRF